jgi:SAM-dependent methyltransferase
MKEWDRMVRDPASEIQFHVHLCLLERFVRAGDAVLEIGPGPGRYTMELARLGARVWVGDISPVQLDLHRQMAEEHGFEEAVAERRQVDLCDLSEYDGSQFDSVVAYGGPLSYVFDRAPQALAGVRRVLKPGGTALFSVMSLWGAIHEYLPGIMKVDVDNNRHIVASGDLHPSTYPEAEVVHRCHMYRATELANLIREAGFEVAVLSASNCLSAVAGDRLDEVRNSEKQWAHVLELEVEACQEPGCVDLGSHIIAAGRKLTD